MVKCPRSDRLRRILIPVAYALSGLAVGIGPHQELAAWFGARPGLGVALVINVVLPLVAAILAFIRPRPAWAALGGVALVIGYVAGCMLRREPLFWHWSFGLLKAVTHPILIPAAIAYAIIGTVVAVLIRSNSDRAVARVT